MSSDELLVACGSDQAANGSRPELHDQPASFQALYQRHAVPMGYLVSRSVRDRAEAEDVCQEVWLRLHRNRESIREPAAAGHWLYQVARRLCVDAARRGLRRPAGDELPDALPAQSHEGPEATSLRNERLRLAWQALAALPPRQHRALFAREVEGRSPAEIGTELECSIAAVETLLARARKGIAPALARVESSRDERCRLARLNARRHQAGESTRVQALALRSHVQECVACDRDLAAATSVPRRRTVMQALAGLFGFGRWNLAGGPGKGLAGLAGRIATLTAPAARVAVLGSMSLGVVAFQADSQPVGPPAGAAPATFGQADEAATVAAVAAEPVADPSAFARAGDALDGVEGPADDPRPAVAETGGGNAVTAPGPAFVAVATAPSQPEVPQAAGAPPAPPAEEASAGAELRVELNVGVEVSVTLGELGPGLLAGEPVPKLVAAVVPIPPAPALPEAELAVPEDGAAALLSTVPIVDPGDAGFQAPPQADLEAAAPASASSPLPPPQLPTSSVRSLR